MIWHNRLTVVYILGFARSGTTILSNILGEVEGLTHVGELDYLWRRLALRRGKCGCQKLVWDCPFWSNVVKDTMNSLKSEKPELATVLAREDSFATFCFELRNSALGTTDRGREQSKMRDYATAMEHLLHSVARASNTRILVDSTKLVEPAHLFQYMPSISPYYVHVIRDPRGSILSRQRKQAKRVGDKFQLNSVRNAVDCMHWVRANIKSSRFGASKSDRYLRINYESFAAEPKNTIQKILEFVGAPESTLPFLDDKTVVLQTNHTVCGNLNRFADGEVEIHLDDGWKSGMRIWDLFVATTLTSPLLLKYGYSLWPH